MIRQALQSSAAAKTQMRCNAIQQRQQQGGSEIELDLNVGWRGLEYESSIDALHTSIARAMALFSPQRNASDSAPDPPAGTRAEDPPADHATGLSANACRTLSAIGVLHSRPVKDHM